MHILFLTENFPPEINAAASRVFERAKLWVRQGHKVTVITGVPNAPLGKIYPGYQNRFCQQEKIEGITVIRVITFIAPNAGIWLRTLDFISFMISSTIRGIGVAQPDVVVATSPQFFTAIAGYFLSVLKRKPFVFELSDLWPESIVAVGALKPSFAIRCLERIELFLYRKAVRVVALTNAFKNNLIARGINKEKIVVIQNGADIDYFSPQAKDAIIQEKYNLQGRFVIGYIGTHGLAHQLENILYTAKFLEPYTEVVFMLVGEGAAKKKMIDLAARMGLLNVRFIPAQPKGEIARYWSVCDLALIHLKMEPTFATVIPSKSFEALAMGIPLLYRGPLGEMSALIQQETVGYMECSGEPERLAQCIVEILQNPMERKLIQSRARNAASRHSRQAQADSFLRVLEVIGHKV